MLHQMKYHWRVFNQEQENYFTVFKDLALKCLNGVAAWCVDDGYSTRGSRQIAGESL